MPWDGSWLWVADLRADGTIGPPTLVAGGPAESVSQPTWSPRGELHFLSDRSGWWNLYVHTDRGTDPVIVLDAELGVAAWEFGYATSLSVDFTPAWTYCTHILLKPADPDECPPNKYPAFVPCSASPTNPE